MATSTTTWSNVYSVIPYNRWATSAITVSNIPAAYSFSYSVAVAEGTPSVFVLDPSVYTAWSTGTTFLPQTYRYGARIDPPTGGRDSFSLIFTSATTYPVLLYCGPYSTTISSVVTISTLNCSGVTINAKWVDLNIAPPAQTTTLPPLIITSTPSPSAGSDGGVSAGAVAGIAVGAVVVAGVLAAAIVVTMLRRRNRKAAEQQAQQQQRASYMNYPPPVPLQPPPPGMDMYKPSGHYYKPPAAAAAPDHADHSDGSNTLPGSPGGVGANYVSPTPQFHPGTPSQNYANAPQFQQGYQGYASPGLAYAQLPSPGGVATTPGQTNAQLPPGSPQFVQGGYGAPLPNTTAQAFQGVVTTNPGNTFQN
ncbi:hypothetical protein BJ742DRAFT_793960 [Cladochytrium replicatum]|nr:hypothetical protein BJ742DRAFT_793960 [Cladochytrium replicatum]